MCRNKSAPPRATENKVEDLCRIEIVDVIITKHQIYLEIEKCAQFLPSVGVWTSVGIQPPGQPSRNDESSPAADLSISPSRVYCDM